MSEVVKIRRIRDYVVM